MMKAAMKYGAPVAFAFLLSACGGGSSSSGGGSGSIETIEYSGASTAASLSSSNKDAFASSSEEVVTKAITADSSGDALDNVGFAAVSSKGGSADQAKLAKQAVDSVLEDVLAGVPVAATQSVAGDCGGSASYSGSESSATIAYSNFCIDVSGGTMVADGTVKYSYSTSGDIETSTVQYSNFSMTYGGETYTMTGTITDRYNMTEYYSEYSSWNYVVTQDGVSSQFSGSMTCTSYYSCEYYDQIKGSDGSVYQVSDLYVYDSGSYYTVEATFYHPEYGYVDLEASNITLCSDGSVASGTISLEDNSGTTITVTFNGCGSSPTVTLN